MARGINLRHALRLPTEWVAARRILELWGSSLPIGAAGFHVTRGTNASSVPIVTTAELAWSTVVDDRETWWPNGGGSVTDIVTPRELSGVYHLETSVYIGLVAIANWSVSICVNGVAVASSSHASAEVRRSVSAVVPLRAGDVLSVTVRNASNASITPTALAAIGGEWAQAPYFRGYRLSLL